MQDNQHNLKSGTILNQYKVIRVLGMGGFGITYLAQDLKTNAEVVIKEYFPNELAIRNFDSSIIAKTDAEADFKRGLQRFKEEAKTLIQFKHPSIVKILGYFEANSTAYFVMKYEGGIDLDKHMQQHQTPFSQDEIIEIIMPILEGLKEVHAHNYLHRDIKPANILLRENKSPVLIDFGASKIALGEVSKSITTILTAGYAPPEQYSSDVKKQGVFTDLYSLAAVIHKMITGTVPPDAQTRSYALLTEKKDPYYLLSKQNIPGYDQYFLKAIDSALSMEAKRRPQSVQAFQKNILGTSVAPVSQPTEVIDMGNTAFDEFEPSGLFSLEGRINRLRYWLNGLIPIAIMMVGVVILGATTREDTGTNPIGGIIMLVAVIIAIWISVAINVKRWHDLDHSGWWTIAGFIPYVNVIVLIILGFVKGTEGPNRFGTDPLGGRVSVDKYDTAKKIIETPGRSIKYFGKKDFQESYDSVTLLGVGQGVPSVVLKPNMEIIIGRSGKADIRIDNKYVSGQHLSLSLDSNRRVQVRDLSSSNGTYLEGRKLEPNIPYELKTGQKLLVASEDVVYTL
jgi:serine/threonine protein kinase